MPFGDDKNFMQSGTAFGFSKAHDEGLRQYMNSVYANVGIGMLITGVMAFVVAAIPQLAMFLASGVGSIIMLVGMLWFVFWALNPARMHTKSVSTLRMTFFAFSAFLGAFYSIYVLMYTGEALARVFFITSAMFLSASLYGYVTKKNLTSMRGFLMMGVWGLFIALLVNMFLQSTMVHLVASAIGVLLFTAMTAFDTQNIKRMYMVYGNSEQGQKIGILGAMSLYWNFVLIFQFLLSFTSQR